MTPPLISVCIPCQNRSRVKWDGGVIELFPECVRSIRQAALDAQMPVELVVADFGSTDWPPAEWVPDAFAPFPAKVIQSSGVFTVGGGKNLAAENASASIIFFCEADMLVPARVLVGGLQSAGDGFGYFPLYQRYHDSERRDAYWGSGHGCCVVRREHWVQNRWAECAGWGCGEDDKFAHWFWLQDLEAREKVEGFYHMWHPISVSKRQSEQEGR